MPIASACVVESGTLRAVASTVAAGSTATWSSAGSTIENLRVLGKAVPIDLNQTTRISLNPLLFGPGSYVAINERMGSVSGPSGVSGGTWASDLTVNMIHVKITGLVLGLQRAEVVVAQANSHSDFPQTRRCHLVPQSVSGHAFIASLRTVPQIADVLQGFVRIAPTGGDESQHIVDVGALSGSVLSAKVADTRSVGSISRGLSRADSIAEVAGDGFAPACVLRAAACLVSATAVRSEAHASATPDGAVSSDAGTVLADLKVLGIPISVTPEPNATIKLPGIGSSFSTSSSATGLPRCRPVPVGSTAPSPSGRCG